MKRMMGAALAVTMGLAVAGAAPAQQGANAAIVTKSGPLPTPSAGQGLVVFYRPGSLMGAALGYTVHEGQAEVARLGSGKFYAVAAAPGPHQYRIEAETTDRINLEVEAGGPISCAASSASGSWPVAPTSRHRPATSSPPRPRA